MLWLVSSIFFINSVVCGVCNSFIISSLLFVLTMCTVQSSLPVSADISVLSSPVPTASASLSQYSAGLTTVLQIRILV
jgi:hypothetical protein